MELLRKVEAILKEVTYKPGSYFKALREASDPCITVSLCCYVVDVTNPERTIPIVSIFKAPEYFLVKSGESGDLEELILHQVKYLVKQLEMHEVDEFLKYKGKYVTDPHPELNKKPPEG